MGRKGANLCGWRSGEDLGRLGGGETINRIHCVKKKTIFNKTKNLEEKSRIPIVESNVTIISGNNCVIRLGTPVFTGEGTYRSFLCCLLITKTKWY